MKIHLQFFTSEAIASTLEEKAVRENLSISLAANQALARGLGLSPETVPPGRKRSPKEGRLLARTTGMLKPWPMNFDELTLDPHRHWSVYKTLGIPGAKWGDKTPVTEADRAILANMEIDNAIH